MQLSPGTSRRRLVDPTQPPTLIEPETAVLWAGATEAGSRPASPAQPSLHYATDTPAVTLWDGSTWRSMGGATLPSATAAGQMLLSTGSGTSYAARARVLSGTLAERDARLVRLLLDGLEQPVVAPVDGGLGGGVVHASSPPIVAARRTGAARGALS